MYISVWFHSRHTSIGCLDALRTIHKRNMLYISGLKLFWKWITLNIELFGCRYGYERETARCGRDLNRNSREFSIKRYPIFPSFCAPDVKIE